jgi:hypothetical protein
MHTPLMISLLCSPGRGVHYSLTLPTDRFAVTCPTDRLAAPTHLILQEAALEKAAAGEGRQVEHVALHEDGQVKSAALATPQAQQGKRRCKG